MTDHNDTGATARPWRVEEGTTLIWGACNPDDLSSYGMGHPVAQACLSRGWNQRHEPTIDQAMANAALIVEAVNAYEPLKARLAEVERERDDIRDTLNAWFDTSNKLEPDVSKLLLDGLNLYIRRSESGGMPFKLADDLRAVLADFCRLYVGNLLTPYIERSKGEARALAAEQKEAGK